MRGLHAFILLAVVSVSFSADLRGIVVGISDGDTISLLVTQRNVKKRSTVRLEGINAPEVDQPFGKVSRQFLAALVFRKVVSIKVTGKDKYGRSLGFVKVGGIDVNQTMVRSGMAWWYRKYAPSNKILQQAEAEARSRKSGLWAAKSMPPWEWRHGGKIEEFLKRARGRKVENTKYK